MIEDANSGLLRSFRHPPIALTCLAPLRRLAGPYIPFAAG
jgi:hypothetical protein